MKIPANIKKPVTLCLLMLFTLSITPAVVFHSWLANHSDSYNKNGNSKSVQVGKPTFNCQLNHIVAESAFAEPGKISITCPLYYCPATQTELCIQPYRIIAFGYALRGPPAV